jgi:hypothetical protein
MQPSQILNEASPYRIPQHGTQRRVSAARHQLIIHDFTVEEVAILERKESSQVSRDLQYIYVLTGAALVDAYAFEESCLPFLDTLY